MDVLFFLLSFVCLMVLIIGLIKPTLAIKWGLEENKNRKTVLKYYGIGMIIFFILFAVNVDNSDVEKDNISKLATTIEKTITADEKAAADLDAKISALGDIDSITLDRSDEVQAVSTAYEELTSDQKEIITNLTFLTAAKGKIIDLQTAADQAAAEALAAADAQAAIEAKAAADQSAAQSQNNDYTVYITDTGSKYHSAGCRYLRQSQTSISKSNAVNQGYSPCSICNP